MIVARKEDRNDFERARRAKVLSVDPTMPARNDIDGRQRQLVLALLGSFDAAGMTAAGLRERTLALWDAAAANVEAAMDGHRAHLARCRTQPPASPPDSLARADELLGNRFTFQQETHDLGPEIDWNHNPGREHWAAFLNRFQFLATLADACQATGRRCYADKGISLILHWIGHTDICASFMPGPDPAQWRLSVCAPNVWLSHLEPAIHLVQWAQFLARLWPTQPDLLSQAQWLAIVKSVHEQLRWLELVIPEGGHGNGLTLGAASQLVTLAHFPALAAAPALAQVALARLQQSLERQILPDGVQHELSPHYHACVAADLLHVLEVQEHLPAPAPPSLVQRVTQMLEFLRHSQTPDGMQVAFNDGEGDSGVWVQRLLQSPAARKLLDASPAAPLTSRVFPYAGFVTLRQGPGHGRDELYLAFDAGPCGNCHQHEDALSFWLSAFGRSLIVDPGRHLYDRGSHSYWPHLCSTRAHSTVRIDDLDQRSIDLPAHWVARARLPINLQTYADGSVGASAGYEHGYGPEHLPVRHFRSIRFRPDPGCWIVRDEITGPGRHLIESRLQFAPGALRVTAGRADTCFADANLAVFFPAAAWDQVLVEKAQENPRSGWCSFTFGNIEPAPAMVLRSPLRDLPAIFVMVLLPYRGSECPAESARAARAMCLG